MSVKLSENFITSPNFAFTFRGKNYYNGDMVFLTSNGRKSIGHIVEVAIKKVNSYYYFVGVPISGERFKGFSPSKDMLPQIVKYYNIKVKDLKELSVLKLAVKNSFMVVLLPDNYILEKSATLPDTYSIF